MNAQYQQFTVEFSDGRKVSMSMPVMFTEAELLAGEARVRHMTLGQPMGLPAGCSWADMREATNENG